MITFEFFGAPRLRAGTARLTLDEPATALGPALDRLGRECPALAGTVLQAGGRAHPAYRLCLNGERFVSDPGTPLAEGDVLLVLSADVGG